MVSLNYSPVIFLVLVMGDSLVVDQVEQSGEADSSLEEWSQTAVFGQTVLVVPAPVSSVTTRFIKNIGILEEIMSKK